MIENLPRGTDWVWLDMATYDILAADVNRPITLQLGKREAGAEIDMLVFSPVALDLAAAIPEPATLSFCVTALALLSRRRTRTPARLTAFACSMPASIVPGGCRARSDSGKLTKQGGL